MSILEDIIKEYNDMKEDGCWEDDHPIVQMAEEIDRLRVRSEYVSVPIDLIKAVAHIGVDFGYGDYQLEKEHIEKAREIYTISQITPVN